jgi:hypothetical protein
MIVDTGFDYACAVMAEDNGRRPHSDVVEAMGKALERKHGLDRTLFSEKWVFDDNVKIWIYILGANK